ncbi:MAG: transglycosylase-associated protein [Nocardioides sp.]|nr:transglycosylase-associated protein [Nocardioides sp.]
MVAFLVAGVILGVLARTLRHGPGDHPLVVTVAAGVVAAAAGGAGMNLLLGDPVLHLGSWSFTSACIVGMVALGLLEGRPGRA